ncbi:MAG: thioredoxin [Candidatus Woesebacteria bacterium]|jgi:thioredoxin 1
MADKKGAAHLNDDNFKQSIQKAGKPVMVDFYADWCGPCQMAAPIIDKLADEYKDKIMIVKVNVDENQTTAKEYGVMSIPTVIIFEADGKKIKEVKRQVGFPGEAGLKAMIEGVLD